MSAGDGEFKALDPNDHGKNDDIATVYAALSLDGGDDLDVLSTNGRATLSLFGSVTISNFESQL